MNPASRLMLSFAIACSVYIVQQGGCSRSSAVLPSNLPVKSPGFHCVILRQAGVALTGGQAATLGSQDVEDEATDSGGVYATYWDTQAAENILPEHREVVQQMKDASGLPKWCLCDSGTRTFEIGDVPEDVDVAITKIRETRGAR